MDSTLDPPPKLPAPAVTTGFGWHRGPHQTTLSHAFPVTLPSHLPWLSALSTQSPTVYNLQGHVPRRVALIIPVIGLSDRLARARGDLLTLNGSHDLHLTASRPIPRPQIAQL